MRVVDAGDRLHVYTPRYEWTILRGFNAGRGPCYISDVRSRRRPYRQVVTDGHATGHTINDPLGGGLFSFGVVAARNLEALGVTTAAGFWSNAWEVTTRMDAGPAEAFGVADPAVEEIAGGIRSSCTLCADGAPAVAVAWHYRFGPSDRVVCNLSAVPFPRALWIKEPKIVANGLHGYRTLTVRDRSAHQLGPVHDLTRYTDPRRVTLQVGDPARFEYVLAGAGLSPLTVTSNGALALWKRTADQMPAMSQNAIRLDGTYGPAAGYCLADGGLKAQTEVPRWGPPVDVAGLALHGWEGGYGAPDCWNTFRPWPTDPIVATLVASFGVLRR